MYTLAPSLSMKFIKKLVKEGAFQIIRHEFGQVLPTCIPGV